MFAKTVLHIDGERFELALDQLKHGKGVTGDLDLDAADLSSWSAKYKADRRRGDGRRGSPRIRASN